jgi:hypothetical protein
MKHFQTMPRPSAYGQGFRNYLQEMAWQPGGGSMLGGRVNSAAVNRAYHNAALLWRGAAPDFRAARMPNLDLTGRIAAGASGQAMTPNNPYSPLRTNWVGLDPHMIRRLAALTSSEPGLRNMPPSRLPPALHAAPYGLFTPASRTLLHEWAHVFQSPRTYGLGQKAIEGGAEAYSRNAINRVLGRLGARAQPGTRFGGFPWAYPEWTAMVQRAYGPNWVRRGQFR